MSNILRPNVRWALNQKTSDSSQDIFGSDSNVFKNLEENKKMSTLLKSVMLQTKKPVKAGKKPGAKGAGRLQWGVEGQGQENPQKKPSKRKPRRTLTTSRTRRLPKRRTRSLMNHVS